MSLMSFKVVVIHKVLSGALYAFGMPKDSNKSDYSASTEHQDICIDCVLVFNVGSKKISPWVPAFTDFCTPEKSFVPLRFSLFKCTA